jgi:hypothetical protein
VRASIGGACGLAHCGALACRWPGMSWPVLGGAHCWLVWPGIGRGLAGDWPGIYRGQKKAPQLAGHLKG